MPNPSIRNLKPILNGDDVLLDTPKTAELITGLRKKFKIAQKVLAIEMNISISYLSDLESAKRRWSLDLFNRAKNALERVSDEA